MLKVSYFKESKYVFAFLLKQDSKIHMFSCSLFVGNFESIRVFWVASFIPHKTSGLKKKTSAPLYENKQTFS